MSSSADFLARLPTSKGSLVMQPHLVETHSQCSLDEDAVRAELARQASDGSQRNRDWAEAEAATPDARIMLAPEHEAAKQWGAQGAHGLQPHLAQQLHELARLQLSMQPTMPVHTTAPSLPPAPVSGVATPTMSPATLPLLCPVSPAHAAAGPSSINGMTHMAAPLNGYCHPPPMPQQLAPVPPQQPGWSSIFIKGLPEDADKLWLYEKFARYGAVDSVRVLVDADTGLCTGVGYVNYGDGTAAAKAAEVMNGVRVQDRLLHVMVQRHPPGRKEPPHGSSYHQHQHQHQHSYHHSGMGATAHSRHESPEAYGMPHYQSQQAQQWTWQQAASVLACFVPPPQQGVQVQQGMQGWPAGPNRM